MHIVPIAPDIDPSLAIRESDIRRFFPPGTLSAARSYEQRGRVQDLEIADRGAVITATTQGTRPDPYVQTLRISQSPTNELRIAGACNCPVGRGCKHLAAVLMAAQRKEQTVPRRQEALFQATPKALKTELPAQIKNWLADFDREDEELTEEYPSSIRNRIFYVLNAETNAPGVPRLLIDTMTVSLRKDNSVGTVKRYAPHQINSPAKYLRPSDLRCGASWRPDAPAGPRPRWWPWPKVRNAKARSPGSHGRMPRSRPLLRWTRVLSAFASPRPGTWIPARE
jgi:hypothetical protein